MTLDVAAIRREDHTPVRAVTRFKAGIAHGHFDRRIVGPFRGPATSAVDHDLLLHGDSSKVRELLDRTKWLPAQSRDEPQGRGWWALPRRRLARLLEDVRSVRGSTWPRVACLVLEGTARRRPDVAGPTGGRTRPRGAVAVVAPE